MFSCEEEVKASEFDDFAMARFPISGPSCS